MWPFSSKCVECDAAVKKQSKFCSKCGAASPNGWVRCPSCGKWAGAHSNNCPHCSHALEPELVQDVANNNFRRGAQNFLVRLDIADFEKRLKAGLTIEEGSVGVVLEEGAFAGLLEAGTHNLTHSKLAFWKANKRYVVYLVAGAEVAIQIDVEDLRSSEEIPMSLSTILIFRFNRERAESLVTNFVGDGAILSVGAMGERFGDEIAQAARNLANSCSAEALIKDPTIRTKFDAELQEVLGGTFAGYGIELVRLTKVEFGGKEFNELRKGAGEVELKRREVELEEKWLEATNSGEMVKLKSELEWNDYRAQMETEYGLKSENRAAEVERARSAMANDTLIQQLNEQKTREIQELRNSLETESMRYDYQFELAIKKLRYERTLESEDVDAQSLIVMKQLKSRIDQELEEVRGIVAKGDAKRDFELQDRRERLHAELENQEKVAEVEARIASTRRQQSVQDAGAAAEEQTILSDQKIDETAKWLKVKELKRKGELDHKQGEIELDLLYQERVAALDRANKEHAVQLDIEQMRAKAEVQAEMAAAFEGKEAAAVAAASPEAAAGIAELERLKAQQAMSADQILASQAGESAAAAEAAGRAIEAKHSGQEEAAARELELQEKRVKDLKEVHDESANRLERIAGKSIDAAAGEKKPRLRPGP